MELIVLVIIGFVVWVIYQNSYKFIKKEDPPRHKESSIDWQEEEQKKRNQRENEVNLCNKIVLAFWEELKAENEKLSPELRLKYTYNSAAKNRLNIKGDDWSGIGLKESRGSYEGGIGELPNGMNPYKISGPYLDIYYNLKSGRLDLICSEDQNYGGVYKIDERSASNIIRNICQDKAPFVFGLTRR